MTKQNEPRYVITELELNVFHMACIVAGVSDEVRVVVKDIRSREIFKYNDIQPDHTEALERKLREFHNQGHIAVNVNIIPELASRLNAAIKAKK
jgi:hypothetical protein